MKKFCVILGIFFKEIEGLQVRMSLAPISPSKIYTPNWVFWKAPPTPDSKTDIIVAELGKKLADDVTMREMLESSLRRAKAAAHHLLSAQVLAKYKDFPTEAQDFIIFASSLANNIPAQDSYWNDVLREESVQRLSHFFYLVNSPIMDVATRKNRKHLDHTLNDVLDSGGYVDDYGPLQLQVDEQLRDDPWFNNWLNKYVAAFGQSIDLTKSDNLFPFASILGGEDQFSYIYAPLDNRVPTAPCDGILDAVHRFVSGDSLAPKLDLPDVLCQVELSKLLGDSFAHKFQQNDARLLHFHLPLTTNNHQFQSPVSGKVVSCSTTVEIERLDITIRDGDFATVPNSNSGFPFPRAQAVIIIDTQDAVENNVGKVALIMLGLFQPIHLYIQNGQTIKKGDKLGDFTFPGANHLLLLFQEQAHLKIDAPLGDHSMGDALAHPQGPRALNPQWFLKQGIPFLCFSLIALYALIDFGRYEIQEVFSL